MSLCNKHAGGSQCVHAALLVDTTVALGYIRHFILPVCVKVMLAPAHQISRALGFGLCKPQCQSACACGMCSLVSPAVGDVRHQAP